MGLFKKNEEQEARPVNPKNTMLIRALAVGYLLYTVYNMIRLYMEGGEDAPSLGLLIAAVVLFVGGSVWIGILSFKQWKQMKQAQQAAYEEEERLEAERAAQEALEQTQTAEEE